VRSVDAAVANLSFLIVGPASGGNALARQVNDHLKAFQHARTNGVLIRMPLDLSHACL
jgi:hypothetical protein